MATKPAHASRDSFSQFQEMYSQLLETFIKDSQEKDRLFNAIETIPCISNKAKWCLDWIQRWENIRRHRLCRASKKEIRTMNARFTRTFE